ncbi:isoprenylcysteine carboxylmethyltransferase family protein [Anderseniella sp. Alg231-50]|uniref:isoprenylcysteine carboxyl methyltransferase family protein n=1 Tax=Anderseniella sp. Alg231-50 TaxID=1922226 RepID=UPI000D551DC5
MSISIAALCLLIFLVIQRLGELVLARRNTARLLAKGAYEVGAEHYPLMIALHASWLVALVYFGIGQPVSIGWLAVFAVLQLLRAWIIFSLGGRWTTRIIVVSDPLVTKGPFAWVKHPNYLVVIAEMLTVPMILGLPVLAAVFSALNAAMLTIRISAEEAAIRRYR